ncbi:MAG: hypothetical protein ABIQ40_16445 [Bacteroidia bacterium]
MVGFNVGLVKGDGEGKKLKNRKQKILNSPGCSGTPQLRGNMRWGEEYSGKPEQYFPKQVNFKLQNT